VQRACARAGIPVVGPHRLRHAVATGMVAQGVALTDISQVLRHRGLATTATYAKVDLASLRAVARPWPGSAAMTDLRSALVDYLALRNRLGHELADAARLLPRFVTWMDHTSQSTVTTAVALEWAQLPEAGPDSVIWAHRLTAVRGFARYLSGIDPATEAPPSGLLPERQRWQAPFIYTPADLSALLAAAGRIRTPLKAATYQTLFGLLVATGIRVGEAIRLDTTDIDWDQGVLLIRESKFGKSRHVPVQPSTLDALRGYADRRGEYRPLPGNDSFFVSLTGSRLIYVSVGQLFRQLRDQAGIGVGAARHPRIHDLRHTFAVTTLLNWYRDGGDVAARLPWLSTYLGHHDPRSTYWYLSAVPELLAAAADRLEPIIGAAVTP
jgi:integrase